MQVQVIEVTEQLAGGTVFGGTFTLTFDSRTNQAECGMCIVNSRSVSVSLVVALNQPTVTPPCVGDPARLLCIGIILLICVVRARRIMR